MRSGATTAALESTLTSKIFELSKLIKIHTTKQKQKKNMDSLGRKSSFRAPRAKKVTKMPSSVSTFAVPYENHMITPMLSKKSELWRGSVGKFFNFQGFLEIFFVNFEN